MSTTAHHRVVIIGGGDAGISVAVRLERAGVSDIGVIEPSSTHHHQPLWTLVGGGCAPAENGRRSGAGVMPKDATWIRDRAEGGTPTTRR